MPGSPAPDCPGVLRAGAVWDAHRFDTTRLADWLRTNLPRFAGPIEVAQFHGGASNPTFLLTDAGDGARYVLRKKPPGELLPRTHMIEREHRIMASLGDTAVPVPAMLALCEDAGVIGTAFYVMPFLDGRIYKGNRLADQTPDETRATYRSLAVTLAALHAVDPATVGLGDLARHGGYFARQIALWSRQYAATRTRDVPAMDRLVLRLPALIPAGDPVALTHGDYRIGNVMIARDAPRVLAVLDWELATLGHPLADLGFFCLFYHADFMGWNDGIDWGRDGVPREAEVIADYVAAGGRDPGDDWSFYLAFAAFRLAAIAQNVEHRAAAGISRSAPDRRASAAKFAHLAERLLDCGTS